MSIGELRLWERPNFFSKHFLIKSWWCHYTIALTRLHNSLIVILLTTRIVISYNAPISQIIFCENMLYSHPRVFSTNYRHIWYFESWMNLTAKCIFIVWITSVLCSLLQIIWSCVITHSHNSTNWHFPVHCVSAFLSNIFFCVIWRAMQGFFFLFINMQKEEAWTLFSEFVNISKIKDKNLKNHELVASLIERVASLFQ